MDFSQITIKQVGPFLNSSFDMVHVIIAFVKVTFVGV